MSVSLSTTPKIPPNRLAMDALTIPINGRLRSMRSRLSSLDRNNPPTFRIKKSAKRRLFDSVREDLREEQFRPVLLRTLENILRRAAFHNLTLIEEKHTIGNRTGKAHFVRDHQHRHA